MSRLRGPLLLASLVLALGPSAHPAAGDGGGGPGPIKAAEEAFLERHWRMPLAPQGDPPATFAPIERSLAPADCGTCHPSQYADWQGSIHARSMGPGIAGQLVEMARRDPAGARGCLVCHAPLAEQSPLVRGAAGLEANSAFDTALQGHGEIGRASCRERV